MPATEPVIYALNRGLISALALARIDLKRMALSAEIQTNWMPRTLGSMMLRPGLKYLGATASNSRARMIPFEFATTDVLLIEATANAIRFWVPGSTAIPGALLTRPSVSTAVTNGTFSGSLTGWTDNDGAGAVSQWLSGNFMELTGTGFNAADRYQQVSVSGADLNKEHAVRISVVLGVAILNIGASAGSGEYAMNLPLGPGTHSIAFNPDAAFYIDLSNATQVRAIVQSVSIESAGVMSLPTPWNEQQLQYMRWDQSGEIVYVACSGLQQRKILRWGATLTVGYRSFSIVTYQPMDGPFLLQNITPITLTPSATTGTIALTASSRFFQSGHVGALFKLISEGQSATFSASGTGQFSGAVEVTGLHTDSSRTIYITITGTFVATVKLQQSIGAPGAWTDVTGESWTAPVQAAFNDGFDNQVIFYRIGIGAAYTSGTAVCTISVNSGTVTGVVRVSAYSSPTAVTAEVMMQPGNTGVLSGLGSTVATQDWSEGAWSNVQGWPTAVALHDGRLWWFGRNRVVGSVSDAYESFDETNVNDDGPINRTFGSGPVDVVNWAMSLADLVIGAQGAEKIIRSSVLGSVVTPTDYVQKNCSTQGSAPVPAIKVDLNGIFLQRAARRIYLLKYTPGFFQVDYAISDLTNYVPDIGLSENGVALTNPGFNWMAIQRQPDTRIHLVMNDGTARVLVFDDAEDEHAWIKVETDGLIEDVVVLPGQGTTSSGEDLVYYVVNRTIQGATVRYLELWAQENECWGASMSKLADSHVAGTNGSPSATIAAPHLMGESLICWADGKDQGGPFPVDLSGNITLPAPVTTYCAGLTYSAKFKSAKLAYSAQPSSPLAENKRIANISLILANTHAQGVRYGRDFTSLQSLPLTPGGKVIASDSMLTTFDDQPWNMGGTWNSDSRICLQADAPRPATVMAIVLDMEVK